MRKVTENFLLYAPGNDFVIPYFEREFENYNLVFNPASEVDFSHAVMLSSTGVYNVRSGSDHDESTPLVSRHPMLGHEQIFSDACIARGIKPLILRCPHIVGTGMNGLPRDMVNKIYRGTYFHIKDVNEHLSVVHASDIAQAARAALDSGETLIVTDGANPTYDELAEALAYRLDQKRIFTIKDRWARFRYNAALYNTITNTLTFSCERLSNLYGYRPTPVCQYLTTHVYDEASL